MCIYRQCSIPVHAWHTILFIDIACVVDEGNGLGSGFVPEISAFPEPVSENGSLQTLSDGNVATLVSLFGLEEVDSNNYSCVVIDTNGFIVTVITIEINVLGEKHG